MKLSFLLHLCQDLSFDLSFKVSFPISEGKSLFKPCYQSYLGQDRTLKSLCSRYLLTPFKTRLSWQLSARSETSVPVTESISKIIFYKGQLLTQTASCPIPQKTRIRRLVGFPSLVGSETGCQPNYFLSSRPLLLIALGAVPLTHPPTADKIPAYI